LDLKRSESLDLIKAKRREKSPVKPTEKVSKRSQKGLRKVENKSYIGSI
jgi:hypothetical protein